MFDIKENLKKLPDCPGVYLHKDRLGQVIYVGKAISLKNRVRQYFQSSANHSSKVKAMVSNIAQFEYITCQTEMEALILECNLIKKYKPKYNILLRDDKTYPYIKITLNEEYPRIIKTRVVDKDGSKYFGPYSDVTSVNTIIEFLNKTYALKRCSSKSFPDGYRPCLNYHINQCKGICTGNVDKELYMEGIKDSILFLSGKQKKTIEYLTKKMEEAASTLRFEDAAMYRDYIASAKAISETQRVTFVNGRDLDMVFKIGQGKNTSIVLFLVRDGKLSGREIFYMDTEGADDYETVVGSFIKQYYSQWSAIPEEILLAKELDESSLIEKYLESQGEGRKIRIFVPQKGNKKALLELAQKDVIELSKSLDERAKTAKETEESFKSIFEKLLGVKKDVYRIESYDISNTNGVDTVGAMVVFNNLKKVPKEYRRFKIKTIQGQDDYGSLREMLTRRFKRALEGDASFSTLPDLILMDGGQGQVSSCEKVLVDLKLSIPVLGMAKDDKHRTKSLVNGVGQEIPLREHPMLFKYCGLIQEEVHRFAIDYHRSLHQKNSIGSVLDNIEGIGPKKRNALLSYFKSIEEIKKASIDELKMVDGITSKNAEAIKKYFG